MRKPTSKIKVGAPAPPQTTWFAVLKAYDWDTLSINGMGLRPPAEGPHRFIPVFMTFAQACQFNGGSEENVTAITTGPGLKP